MTRPRVLIFSLAYFPFVGGAEVAVKEITNRLPDYDFEIISADVGNFWSKYFYPFWAYRQATRQHQKQPYNLIWAIMANQAGMATALFKKRFPTVPFLLTLQEGDDLNSLAYRLRLIGPRLFRVFQRADQIQVISNYLGAWARAMGARCPITVIPNGVNFGKFNSQNPRFDFNNQKTIITTSRLVKKNGLDTLIESLQFLSKNVRLRILGSGPEEKSLKRLLSRLNLDNRVEFLGHVPPDQVAGYLTQADVFVRPSRSEGLGNSFLEAMVASVPVVGTAVGGIPDFLYDPQWQGFPLPTGKGNPWVQTGWFCEVDNPKSVAEKIKYILDPANRHLIDQVIVNAQKLVREKYDWKIISQKMAQIIANLVKKRSI